LIPYFNLFISPFFPGCSVNWNLISRAYNGVLLVIDGSLEDYLPQKALFEGLVVDEHGNPVRTGMVGDEPCYIVDDRGFHRHIPAEVVDRQVWQLMQEQIEGHEDLLSEQAAKMLGQEDIFTLAAIQNQLKNMDAQFDQLAKTGIPEESRAYLGMMGFKVIISIHGDVLDVVQPGMIDDSGED
jgi:protocatechuate 3,4-dioxygenase beta subunit